MFEQDGGRLTAGFARDATTGEGYQVLGDPMAFPSASPEIGYEDDFAGAARNSALKDTWATGLGQGYVNAATVAAVSTTSAAVRFTTTDRRLSKQIAWRAPGELEVTYTLEAGAGTLYVRSGLNPNLAGLALGGQAGLSEADAGGVYTLSNTYGGKTVAVRLGYGDAGHTARRNGSASDGTPCSPRNTAFQHLVELEGDAPGFAFSIGVEVR